MIVKDSQTYVVSDGDVVLPSFQRLPAVAAVAANPGGFF
jgi:hypothetical protein